MCLRNNIKSIFGQSICRVKYVLISNNKTSADWVDSAKSWFIIILIKEKGRDTAGK